MRSSKMMLAAISAAAMILTTSAWQNTPPIPERHPGWGEGKGKQMIEFEVFYDLTCSASAAMHPELQEFLSMPFLGATVRDAIFVNYAFEPLPYHHGSWIPHKIIPFIIDKCVIDPLGCKLPYYINFSFNNQNTILSATDMSFNDIVTLWTGMVSQAFGWKQSDLLALYAWETDTHNSEMRVRYNWKYSATQAVSATPSLAVNGIQVQEPPFDHVSMMQLLQDVYNAQQVKMA